VSLFYHKVDFGLIPLLRRPLLSYIRQIQPTNVFVASLGWLIQTRLQSETDARGSMPALNLGVLEQQFKGRTFGELILHHVVEQDYETVVKGMFATIAKLPSEMAPAVESWIDAVAPLGKDPAFWQRDCGAVFREICLRGRQKLADCGVSRASDEDVLWMFQIIVLNFAYGAHKHAGTKAFIQKSIGFGFLRRLFS
jgi:hypothetical protein